MYMLYGWIWLGCRDLGMAIMGLWVRDHILEGCGDYGWNFGLLAWGWEDDFRQMKGIDWVVYGGRGFC